MREMFVGTREESAEDGIKHSFDYYILIDQMDTRGGLACESYGIKIAGAGQSGDAAQVSNITTSISRIDELAELLTRNFVTPASLRDVVDDWL